MLIILCALVLLGPVCLAQPEPVAEVGGKPIFAEELTPLISAQMRQLRNQEYQLKSKALEELIRQKLVEQEAARRGLSADKLYELEADAKVAEPTEGEMDAYYLGQKDRINRPFADVKAQIKDLLKQARGQKARSDYAESLRKAAEVTVWLRPPTVEVAHDPARVKGNPKAAVTIVEFSDFECPFCRRVQPVLGEVLAKYDGRIRLAFRDFPLREIHGNAQSAAEASRCAAEQGKFWEYHDAVFAGSSKLDAAGLLERARGLKLEETAFKSCLESGKYSAAVEQDLQEGARAGVTGTPAFFINGVFLSGAQPLGEFEKVIDAELTAAGGSRPAK